MQGGLTLSITRNPDDVRAAQRLRHDVFVREMGAARVAPDGAEGDAFDPLCDHMVLRDAAHPDRGVIATSRLSHGVAYTAQEFDLSRLLARGSSVAEVGRTCIHPDYRGGMAGLMMFQGMLDHLRASGVHYLVGTASFAGADPARHMPALRSLRAEALAPADIRPVARGPSAVPIDEEPAQRRDMRSVPPLIKTYLRAGAWVGDGAWCDVVFNTVDVCILLDMARLRLPPVARGRGRTIGTSDDGTADDA
ncbi:GNAT family N-acetyltransferase [Jannaschia sp. 2305UL9-9]|uniref:GNAT family N-acetyltransferase n=1 Tax=Jannaschia sp. 2305UL9-9 TaxID=3121638 RepID=UPI0035282AC9